MRSIVKRAMGFIVGVSMLISVAGTPVYAAGKTKLGSQQARDAAQLVLQTITNDTMTDMEKITAVHDYLVIHTAYDLVAYQTNTSPIGRNTYHADGPILYGTGVCQGYAEAFKVYMDLLGIPCRVVSNTNHAWDRVTINGIEYDIDVTWDDKVPDPGPIDPSQVSHMYLFLTPEMMQVMHTDEGRVAYYANIYGAENITTDISPITGGTRIVIHTRS